MVQLPRSLSSYKIAPTESSTQLTPFHAHLGQRASLPDPPVRHPLLLHLALTQTLPFYPSSPSLSTPPHHLTNPIFLPNVAQRLSLVLLLLPCPRAMVSCDMLDASLPRVMCMTIEEGEAEEAHEAFDRRVGLTLVHLCRQHVYLYSVFGIRYSVFGIRYSVFGIGI